MYRDKEKSLLCFGWFILCISIGETDSKQKPDRRIGEFCRWNLTMKQIKSIVNKISFV